MVHQEYSHSRGQKGSQKGSRRTKAEAEYLKLTDRGLRALEATKKRRVVWAEGFDGFGIRVSPTGSKSFVYKYGFDGRDRWMTIGSYPKTSLAKALELYARAYALVKQGEDPAAYATQTAQAQRKHLTVRQLCDVYIDQYAKPLKKSWQEDQRLLRREVVPRWGTRRAKSITKTDVITLIRALADRGAPVSSNRLLSVIRKMFNFAIDELADETGLVSSPCYRVRPRHDESPSTRYLTLAEISTVWRNLDQCPIAASTTCALRLLLLTLQRSNEVRGMQIDEIDVEAETWTIPASRAKNGRTHLVPLSHQAMDLIVRQYEDYGCDGYVFPSTGQAAYLTPSSLSRAVSRNIVQLGVAKFTPHDLRRTGSTQLGALRVSRFVRERILNHTDPSIGSVYDLYDYEEEKRAALELWSDAVCELAAADKVPSLADLRARLSRT